MERLLGLYKKIVRVDILKRYIRILKYKIQCLFNLKLYSENKHNFFLIYTMGKVASSSIYETLRSKLAFNDVFHVHFLTEKNMRWREELKNNKSATLVERFVLKSLKRKRKNRLKVITVVRDITARDLSMIFQNIDSFIPNYDKKNSLDVLTLEEIYKKHDQDLSLFWFENEFEKFLKVNIYDFKFNREKGYSIYHLDNMDLLIFKLEKLNDCFDEALEDFTGIKFKTLISVNETSNKKISNYYKRIKNSINISEKRLESNYNSKLMKHFYTDQEIFDLKNKWSKEI